MAPWSLPALQRSITRAATLEGRVPLLSSPARSSLAKKLNRTDVRRAAVLVPLCVVDDKPSVLFTLRSGNVSTHKSQVSFPGGHLEAGETQVAAARREVSCRPSPFLRVLLSPRGPLFLCPLLP